jgi:peptidyl-prolyl cis-trans isomerase B (cyclophilin B)
MSPITGRNGLALTAAVLVLLGGLASAGAAGKAAKKAKSESKPAAAKKERDMTKTIATLHISQGGKPLGEIQLRFFPDVAPGHVKNFIELAEKGFYDGTHFHRVIPGFMIQGGDPNSKGPDRTTHGTGSYMENGKPRYVKAEFSDKPHVRGTVSMARASSPDSASCQFFICVADARFLDKQYSVFGEAISGMDVADKIVATPRDPNDNPLTDVVITKIELSEEK